MARTINRIELLGRVGHEPERRQTQSGTAVLQLRLATDRRNRDGERQTDWHTVICWGKQAEAVAEYVRKGERVYVAGRLRQHSWESDDGQRRSRVEVHAQEVILLDSRHSPRDDAEDSLSPTRSGSEAPF